MHEFHFFYLKFPTVPVALTVSVLTARVSAVLVCVKVAMVRVATVDLKDAGVQWAPVPVFLPVCVG